MKRAGDLALVLLVAAPEVWRGLAPPDAAIAFHPWSGAVLGVAGLGVLTIAALTGLYLGTRRRLAQALADRADRERELVTERARADERTRLAAEMHDVVTHRLNLMVLHAGALRVAAKDDGVRTAAEELRTAGRQALTELRDLVCVLCSGRPGRIPDVLPDRLANLVADTASTGLEVTLTEHGDADTISPAVRRTMYRVVQEALANVHKHAPGAHTEITIHCGPNSVRAVIRNTAPASAPDALPGTGTGLLGLRSRVEMVGGTLTAGPTPDGGFEVAALLPAFVLPAFAPR